MERNHEKKESETGKKKFSPGPLIVIHTRRTHNLLLVTVRPIVPLPSPNFSRRKTVSLDRDHTNKMSPASNISPAAISQFELQHEKRKQETTNNERKEKRNAILHPPSFILEGLRKLYAERKYATNGPCQDYRRPKRDVMVWK